MFTQWALRPDSGGPGKHRGGLGAIYEIEALADGGAEVFLLGERGKYPPLGVERRRQRRRSIASSIETDAGEATPPLVSKVTDVQDQARPEGAAGNAGRRRLRRSARRAIRDASRATCGSATCTTRARDYGVATAPT